MATTLNVRTLMAMRLARELTTAVEAACQHEAARRHAAEMSVHQLVHEVADEEHVTGAALYESFKRIARVARGGAVQLIEDVQIERFISLVIEPRVPERCEQLRIIAKLTRSLAHAAERHRAVVEQMLQDCGVSTSKLFERDNFQYLISKCLVRPMEAGYRQEAIDNSQALLSCLAEAGRKGSLLSWCGPRHEEKALAYAAYVGRRTGSGTFEYLASLIDMKAANGGSMMMKERSLANSHHRCIEGNASEVALAAACSGALKSDELPVDFQGAVYTNATHHYIVAGRSLDDVVDADNGRTLGQILQSGIDLDLDEGQEARAFMKRALFPMSDLVLGRYEDAKLGCETLRQEIVDRVGRAVYAELRLWMVEGDAWAAQSNDDDRFAQAARNCYREALKLAEDVSSSSKIELARKRLDAVSVEAIAKRRRLPTMNACTTVSGTCLIGGGQSMDF